MKQVQQQGEDKTMGRQRMKKDLILGRPVRGREVGERGGKASSASMLAPAAPALAHHDLSMVPLSLCHGRWVLSLSIRTENVPAPSQGRVNMRHWVKPHNSPRAMLACAEKDFSLHWGCCHPCSSLQTHCAPTEAEPDLLPWVWELSSSGKGISGLLHQCVFPHMSMEANILGVAAPGWYPLVSMSWQ